MLGTTCVVSAALISGAKARAEEFAKQEAEKALQARRSSGGGGTAAASSNGSSDAAAAAGPAGKKASGASPAKQRVGISLAYIKAWCLSVLLLGYVQLWKPYQ